MNEARRRVRSAALRLLLSRVLLFLSTSLRSAGRYSYPRFMCAWYLEFNYLSDIFANLIIR
jgi:hypothetical protein